MQQASCARHPATAAAFRCDGCGQLLCPECAEEGHRLVFCRLCGERALPLGGGGRPEEPPRDIMDRRRRRIARAAVGYGTLDGLAYAFRGTGGLALWGYVIAMAVLDLVAMAVPVVGGCITWAPWLAVAVLIPKFLFRIANSTAQGSDELPDWPDFDPWELGRTALLFLVVVALCLLPAALLLALAGCTPGAILAGELDLAACAVALAAGLVLAVALWIPTFGAVSLYDTFWAALRLDLHARALLVAPVQIVAAVPLLAGLLFLRALLPSLLGAIPVLGMVLGHLVVGYTLFTGAHLVGLYFRRHWGTLEAIYVD